MFKIIFIASLFVLSVYGTAFVADGCNAVAATNLNTLCKKAATAAGSTKACCLAELNDDKLKTPFVETDTTANACGTSCAGKNGKKDHDVKVVQSPTSGSLVSGGKFYACFAPGGQFRFKTGASTAPDAGKEKEGFAKAEALCSATGTTAKALAANGGPINYSWCSGDCSSGTPTDQTAKCNSPLANGDKTRRGLCLEQVAQSCTCGSSGMPADSCAGLAAADVKTKCTATSDGGSPAKKCCLATFDALPTTKKSGASAQAIQAPTKGGKVDGTKYYACYKSSSGKIRFKTGASATNANKEGWVSADSFCATAKVGKAQGGTTGVTFTHTVDTAVTGSSTLGLAGTAKTCVCGASNIFTISFMLLAILASLWK